MAIEFLDEPALGGEFVHIPKEAISARFMAAVNNFKAAESGGEAAGPNDLNAIQAMVLLRGLDGQELHVPVADVASSNPTRHAGRHLVSYFEAHTGAKKIVEVTGAVALAAAAGVYYRRVHKK